jgi:hypothetical protein
MVVDFASRATLAGKGDFITTVKYIPYEVVCPRTRRSLRRPAT